MYRVNTPLVTDQLRSYASLFSALYRQHKRYLKLGTDIKVLRQLLPIGPDACPHQAGFSVPKTKEIADLELPLCTSSSDNLTWQKAVRQVFKSKGLESFLDNSAFCELYIDHSNAYSTMLLASLVGSNY